jgi:hypothetical protein
MAGDDDRRRQLIQQYFGPAARIRLLRETAAFGAPVFVVDYDRGMRHYRTLGSFGPVFGAVSGPEDQVTEQSSMDLLYPAQLVFHYERLMSLSFAMCAQPKTALLLGVGGAAMWRFMRAYLPECAPILVDNDDQVVAIARRWFHLSQRVMLEEASRFLAAQTAQYDVIHVDLYNARGAASFDKVFWGRCIDLLAPGGCLATNWADFVTNAKVRPMAEAQAEVARGRGHECFFVTRRGFRDNLVQYLPTDGSYGRENLIEALERFATTRRLPDRGRGILENCLVTSGYPVNP